MFHVELRQFPHATRTFNLTREELDARVLGPWIAGRPVELDDRRWSPEKAKLAIYEGRALETSEIGLGRGWATVTRTGEDVTGALLAEAQAVAGAPVAALKEEIAARCAQGPLGYEQLLALAGGAAPVAEQAILELLREDRLKLLPDP